MNPCNPRLCIAAVVAFGVAAPVIVAWRHPAPLAWETANDKSTDESITASDDAPMGSASELAVPPRPIYVERACVVGSPGWEQRHVERLGRCGAYLKEADLAFRREEHDVAREYARALLRDEPPCADAERLIEIATEVARTTTSPERRRALEDDWKLVYEQVLRAIRRATPDVKASENWIESISTHVPRFDRDVATSDAEITAKLEAWRVRGLRLEDQNLDQVVDYLRKVTGLEFQITPNVRTTKFDEVRITVPGLDDVSLKWLLDNVITTPYDLRWEPRDGVVTIAMRDEVAGTMRLKYFDVKSLVARASDSREAQISLFPSNSETLEPPELDEPPAALDFPTDPLVASIRATVDPVTWTAEGVVLELKNGTLIVKNRRRTIERVGVYLNERRQAIAASVTPAAPATVQAAVNESPSRELALEVRRWDVEDLVGRASEHGAIATTQPGDDPRPFIAGSLLAALRVVVPDVTLGRLYASLTLSEGIVSARLDSESLHRVARAIDEIRARAGAYVVREAGVFFNDGTDVSPGLYGRTR